MKSKDQWKIQQLLRLAELCDSEERERKQYYMKEIDSILFGGAKENIEILPESVYADEIKQGLAGGFRGEVENRVSPIEVWCDLLEFPRSDFKPSTGREIAEVLTNLGDWKRYSKNKGRVRHGKYGLQTVFERIQEDRKNS